jgi:hypothetical protein
MLKRRKLQKMKSTAPSGGSDNKQFAAGYRPGPKRGSPPSSYRPEFAELAKKMCELGATNAELAGIFGVSISTIDLWSVLHREFADALKIGNNEAADNRVLRALYQRAVGYTYEKTQIKRRRR